MLFKRWNKSRSSGGFCSNADCQAPPLELLIQWVWAEFSFLKCSQVIFKLLVWDYTLKTTGWIFNLQRQTLYFSPLLLIGSSVICWFLLSFELGILFLSKMQGQTWRGKGKETFIYTWQILSSGKENEKRMRLWYKMLWDLFEEPLLPILKEIA